MQIEVKGRNTPVTDELREHVEKRFTKVGKQVSEFARLEIEVYEERNPAIADNQVAEATLALKGVTLRAQDRARDLRHAINLCEEELSRQVKRHREKRRGRRRSARRRFGRLRSRRASARARPSRRNKSPGRSGVGPPVSVCAWSRRPAVAGFLGRVRRHPPERSFCPAGGERPRSVRARLLLCGRSSCAGSRATVLRWRIARPWSASALASRQVRRRCLMAKSGVPFR